MMRSFKSLYMQVMLKQFRTIVENKSIIAGSRSTQKKTPSERAPRRKYAGDVLEELLPGHAVSRCITRRSGCRFGWGYR